MKRLEQAGYPYVPGSHGIPFSELGFTRSRRVMSGSERILDYNVTNTHIGVLDVETGAHLVADVRRRNRDRDYTISFDLVTRDGEHVNEDMYAAKFTKFALKNFRALGHDVRFWTDDWERWSDVYLQFIDALRSTRDEARAVNSTWTAQVARLQGFRLDSIIEFNKKRVRVQFSR